MKISIPSIPAADHGLVPSADRLSTAGLRTIKRYIGLAKPGIVLGNAISCTGGFFLAARGTIDLRLFVATLLGVVLGVSAGCVFNNCIDRDIDARMVRTRGRALVSGAVSLRSAVIYAALMGISSTILLAAAVNVLAASLIVLGLLVYVGLYSFYMKRHSVYGTVIGSLAGAIPPVAGYCAVSDRFDIGAMLLMVIFGLWQMPHSYAIAIFRLDDYLAAAIPVLPIRMGILSAKRRIVGYIIAFLIAALALAGSGFVGVAYAAVVVAAAGYWLGLAFLGFRAPDDRAWARQIFACSIVVITLVSVMISVDFRRETIF